MLTGLSQLNIELSSRCDRQTLCGFCGHQDRKTNPNLKFGDMDYDLFSHIVFQLESPIIISFHRDGDPLTFERLGDALQLCKAFPTSIVTHGEALGKRADEIIGNCTTVTISVIPNDKDRDIQLQSVSEFLMKKGTKSPQVQFKVVGNLTEKELERYKWLDIPMIGRALHNKKGNWQYANSTPAIPEIRVCLDFLGRPTVDWRGRLFICNRLDTTDAGLIGDLTKDTLDNIWNGPKRREMLKAHLAGRRQDANSLCATCNYWGIPAD